MTSHAASSESTHESTLIALTAGAKPDKCELIASCQRALLFLLLMLSTCPLQRAIDWKIILVEENRGEREKKRGRDNKQDLVK